MEVMLGYFSAGVALWLSVFGSHRIWTAFQRIIS